MISSKDIKKKSRGTYDYRCNGNLYVCNWNDNSTVNIASNFLAHESYFRTKRQFREQETVEVSQPNIIQTYNKGMGGVDLMDQLLGSYRPMTRARKWRWPLMLNMSNVSVVNAWKFYSVFHYKDGKKCGT